MNPGSPIVVHRVSIDALWEQEGRGDRVPRWLSDAEGRIFQRLRVPKRRRDWLAGRYAAKWAATAIADCGLRIADYEWPGFSWRRMKILSVEGGPEHGRPYVVMDGKAVGVDVSISHSGGMAAACAVGQPGIRVGVDVECITEREESFAVLALTPAERYALAGLSPTARAEAVTQRWALKEALVKATGTGLRACLTDLDIMGVLNHGAVVRHPSTGQALSIAGWGSQTQSHLIYAWVTLKMATS